MEDSIFTALSTEKFRQLQQEKADLKAENNVLREENQRLKAAPGFWEGLKDERIDALKEENEVLRAAVAEMDRMLPVLEYFTGDDRVWGDAVRGEDADLNAYRLALENALAKIQTK